ncbi:MAG: hypothetical protein ACYC1K_01550 [Minisyncoccota bacterium]
MYKKIVQFFDRLEDKIRAHLSKYPFAYALIGGVGVVLFWRGVWHTADVVPVLNNSIVSLVAGSVILLLTGIFVSAFVGSRLIMTGLRGEKKMTEKTREEIEEEEGQIKKMQTAVNKIEEEIVELKKDFEEHHPDK